MDSTDSIANNTLTNAPEIVEETHSQISTASTILVESEDNGRETPTQTSLSSNNSSCSDKGKEKEERPSKKAKFNETLDDEGTLCVICYEVWEQTGEHRIASLKCGHLFGHKCILRWLAENKVCPSCKTKASKRDIRFIYANKLIAIDNGELVRLQRELNDSNIENSNLQIELTSVLCKLALVNADVEKYKLQIEQLKNLSTLSYNKKPVESNLSLKHVGNYMVCPQGSCRVMDYILGKTSIVASMKSGNCLFPGFGVKQFNSETFVSLSYTPLHTKVIRDMCFNQANARLLSVSLDKHFNIANIYSSDTNLKQNCGDMLWSCCWDRNDTNVFYVGGQQGAVKVFDSRYITETPISVHSVENDLSPVVSIVSIPSTAGGMMPQGGFIACKLNSLWAFEKVDSTIRQQMLPIDGPFISMAYFDDDKHLLLSARPNVQEPFARHIVCNLRKEAGVLCCNRIHTFTSGRTQKQLARSCFLRKDDCTYVATPNDATVQLWNSQSGFPVSVGHASGAVIDLLPLKNLNGMHVIALTEKKLNVFKVMDQ